MIYALIIAALGIFVAALATLVTFALRANSRLTREKNAAMRALEAALAGKEALKAENGKLQQELHYVLKERNELQARSAALQEALEAKPTQPKRVVPKRTTQTTE